MGLINIYSHRPLSSKQRYNNFSSEYFLGMLWKEPGAAGWEASMLPLCYAAPQIDPRSVLLNEISARERKDWMLNNFPTAPRLFSRHPRAALNFHSNFKALRYFLFFPFLWSRLSAAPFDTQSPVSGSTKGARKDDKSGTNSDSFMRGRSSRVV